MDAKVLLAKCRENGQMFGIRAEKRKNDWIRTFTFKVDEERAKNEGFNETSISGTFDKTEDYPGCPYCQKMEFFTCPTCGKLTCIIWDEKTGICRWCGTNVNDLVWDRRKTELQSTSR